MPLILASGATIVSSGPGLPIAPLIHMSQISTPSDPVSGRVGIYIKAIDSTNDGIFAKIRVQNTITEVRIY